MKYLITEEKFDEVLEIVSLGSLGLLTKEDIVNEVSKFPESAQEKILSSIMFAQFVKEEEKIIKEKLKKLLEGLKNPKPIRDGKSIEKKFEDILKEAFKDDEGGSAGTCITVR